MARTEEARGWGVRVGGPRPYLAWFLSSCKREAELEWSDTDHRAVRVVLLPLAEFRRLKRLDARKPKPIEWE